MDFKHKIRLLYPWPLARAYEAYTLETDVRNQVTQLIKLIEKSVQYASILLLGAYVHVKLQDETVEQSRNELESPSFGQWTGLYRECFNAIEKQSIDFLELSTENFSDGHVIRECTRFC